MNQPNIYQPLKLQELRVGFRAQLWPPLPASFPVCRTTQKWSDSFHGRVKLAWLLMAKQTWSFGKKKQQQKITSKQQCILEKIKVSMISLNIALFLWHRGLDKQQFRRDSAWPYHLSQFPRGIVNFGHIRRVTASLEADWERWWFWTGRANCIVHITGVVTCQELDCHGITDFWGSRSPVGVFCRPWERGCL